MKLNLKLQLIISYAMISIFLVLTFFSISSSIFQKQFQRYMIEEQEIKNEEIRQVIINAYGENGEVPELSFFKNFGELLLEQNLILSVFDKNDNELFCVYCLYANRCNHAITTIKEMMKNTNPNFKGKYTEKKMSMEKDGTYLGYIKLEYYGPYFYNESDQNFIKTFNNLFIGVALISFIISIVVGLVMANRIANPIKKVIKRTKDISEGNYVDKIEVTPSLKEIEQLANSVNALANNLQEQLEIKKQMAGDFTHEFLTPLTVIQGNIEAMLDGVFEPTTERLENLKLDIERLARLVYDIEKIVSTDNSKKLKKVKYNIINEINNILKTFEQEITSKNITVNFSNKTKHLIYADKDKMNQVIINLISNAIKYSYNYGKIDIDIISDKEETKIVINDNGIGIKERDMPYIFEYLYRADKSRSRNSGGSGIGLYVVKNIVESHNGEVTVESEVNKGSKFIIKIPN